MEVACREGFHRARDRCNSAGPVELRACRCPLTIVVTLRICDKFCLTTFATAALVVRDLRPARCL